MPTPIKPIPGAKVFTSLKPFTQAKPVVTSKPITISKPQAPPKPLTISKGKLAFTGQRVMSGGLVVTHTCEVIDNSSDLYQTLPFIASCITCGWQAHVSDRSEAISFAQGHVNNFSGSNND